MKVPLSYDSPIQRHLHPSERVTWVGRPRQGWAVPFVIPLLLPLQGWAVILLLWWTGQLLQGRGPYPFAGGGGLRAAGFILAVGLATAWQAVADRRRRAGTWYALTSDRVLFVRTDVVPESAIGIDLDNIAKVRLNRGRSLMWHASSDAIRIEVVKGDPYLSSSSVMGYQNSGNIDLIDIPDSRILYDLLRHHGTSPAREV